MLSRATLLCLVFVLGTVLHASGAAVPKATTRSTLPPKCTQDMFQCRSGRCIPNTWLCDNDSDCEDSDDEERCQAKAIDECAKTEFRCETRSRPFGVRSSGHTFVHSIHAASLFTNLCIPNSWKCDGETDCLDGSDEINCNDNNVTCTAQQFQCRSYEGHSSTCIPLSWKCDGTEDCAGGFDEQGCSKEQSHQQCDPGLEFKCAGNGRCIYNGWKCDGEEDVFQRDDDCGDGKSGEPSSDEKDCAKKTCDDDEHFKCKTVQFCVLSSWRCDGEADCPDQSDEHDCKEFHVHKNVTCDGKFRCASGSHCINAEFVCDGDNDCADASDEIGCKEKEEVKCKDKFKACNSGICRPETDFCNGRKDCPDGEDELNCPVIPRVVPSICNADTEYTCPKETPLRCIPYKDLCKNKDSGNDCAMSSVCNKNLLLGTCNYTDAYCSCRDMYTRNGTVCLCPDGFETKNGFCVDVDECTNPGICDQGCENLPGSFRCHCHRGYRLVRENDTTKATKCRAVGSDPLILLSNRAAIRQYDMQTNTYTPLINRLESAVAMDYWHKNETLIWSDVSKEKIMMCPIKRVGLLNQTSCSEEGNTTLVSDNISTPDGLAIDWVHGLLFWTDTGLDAIYVLDLTTKNRRAIITDGLDEPRAIAVDPSAGLIFWSDWGSNAKIERAGMDGKDRMTILSGNSIRWPNGLAVDILDKRLYWADAKTKTISSSDYYGQDVRTVLHSSEFLRHPFSLAVFEERLYWSDWDKEGVLTVNKFRGDDVKVLISGVSGPMTVRVYHEQAQPNHTNKCHQNTCSHLCLPRAYLRANDSQLEITDSTFRPYTCACAMGYLIDSNDLSACILEKAVEEITGGGSTVATGIFFVIAVVCAVGLVGYIWNSRRPRPLSVLRFDNPVYRRTTEDADTFEFDNPHGDNSLGAFPSDINPPLLPSRLVLNQPRTSQPSQSAQPLNPNSENFYHPSNYAYDQPIVRENPTEERRNNEQL